MSISSLHTQEVLTLNPSLAFGCIVEEKPLQAKLTHIQANFFHYIYHVSFTDGYSSGFVQAEGLQWEDMSLEPKYVAAIKDDLQAIAHHDFSTLIFCFPYPINGKKTNVWVLQGAYAYDEVYFFFYNGLQQFTLMKEEDYQIVTFKSGLATKTAKAIATEAIKRIKAQKQNHSLWKQTTHR